MSRKTPETTRDTVAKKNLTRRAAIKRIAALSTAGAAGGLIGTSAASLAKHAPDSFKVAAYASWEGYSAYASWTYSSNR